MKMILKVLALPLLFMVTLLCLLGKLVEHLSSYVMGLFLLFLCGCVIYCIVQAQWMQVGILVGTGLIGFLALFVLVWILMQMETFQTYLGEFIHS